jgi:hypothetical protein
MENSATPCAFVDPLHLFPYAICIQSVPAYLFVVLIRQIDPVVERIGLYRNSFALLLKTLNE